MSSCGCDPVPSCTSLPCAGLKQTVGVGSHPTGQRRRDMTLPTHTAQTLLVSLPFSSTGLSTLTTTLALQRTGAGVGEEEPAETITFDGSLSRPSSMSELGRAVCGPSRGPERRVSRQSRATLPRPKCG